MTTTPLGKRKSPRGEEASALSGMRSGTDAKKNRQRASLGPPFVKTKTGEGQQSAGHPGKQRLRESCEEWQRKVGLSQDRGEVNRKRKTRLKSLLAAKTARLCA